MMFRTKQAASSASSRITTLRVMGDSHTTALADGWDLMPVDKRDPSFDVQIRGLGSGKHFHRRYFEPTGPDIRWLVGEYVDNFTALTGRPTLSPEDDVLYAMCMSFHTAFIAAKPTWRTSAPWRVAGKLGLTAVSDAVMGEIAREYARHSLDLFDAMLERNIRFFVICSPPIKTDWRPLQAMSPEVALEIDRLFREAISQHLTARGVQFAPPPRATVAPSGFLKPEFAFAEDDPHHANGAYGKLMMADVLKLAAEIRRQQVQAQSGE